MDGFGRIDVFLLAAEISFADRHGMFEVFWDYGICQIDPGCEVAVIDCAEECL